MLASLTLFYSLRLCSKGCYTFYSSVPCASTFYCYWGFLVVPSGTGRWQVELQGTVKAWAMLAQSVTSSFRLTTQGALVSHGVICVLYAHMCRAGCSSRPRHLALLQDLAADEPSCLFHLQEAFRWCWAQHWRRLCRWNRSRPPSCSAHNHCFWLWVRASQSESDVSFDTVVKPHFPCLPPLNHAGLLEFLVPLRFIDQWPVCVLAAATWQWL